MRLYSTADQYEWHRWIAWHPVYSYEDECYIWFERCERKRVIGKLYDWEYWDYRLIKKDGDPTAVCYA